MLIMSDIRMLIMSDIRMLYYVRHKNAYYVRHKIAYYVRHKIAYYVRYKNAYYVRHKIAYYVLHTIAYYVRHKNAYYVRHKNAYYVRHKNAYYVRHKNAYYVRHKNAYYVRHQRLRIANISSGSILTMYLQTKCFCTHRVTAPTSTFITQTAFDECKVTSCPQPTRFIFRTDFFVEIWGNQNGDYEDSFPAEFETLWPGKRVPTFQKVLFPPT